MPATNHQQRHIEFAERSVTIDYAGERCDRLLDYVFADIPSDTAAAPHQTLVLDHCDEDGTLRYVDQYKTELRSEVRSQTASDGAVANALLGDVIYHLADRCDSGMVFHAGAVRKGNKCIVLPGQSGAGKTSVTAWLTQSGYHYITDEVIYVRAGATDLNGFTRPFNFKTPVLGIVKRDLGIDADDFPTFACDFATLIPHRQFNANYLGNSAQMHSVIFPQYSPDTKAELVKISSAQTALGLMACLVNGRNLEEHGFRTVTQLARSMTGYQLHYSHFAQLPDLMQSL